MSCGASNGLEELRPIRSIEMPETEIPPSLGRVNGGAWYRRLFTKVFFSSSSRDIIDDNNVKEEGNKKNILMVGQTNFDGQIVRLVSLATSTTSDNDDYSFNYLSFSGGDPLSPEMVSLSSMFDAAGAGFRLVTLPSVTVSYTPYDKGVDPWDDSGSPACGTNEIFATCFNDGAVDYMIKRLESLPPLDNDDDDFLLDDLRPEWTRETWNSILKGLKHFGPPDAVILSNSGMHQDRLVTAGVRYLFPRVPIFVDLPNVGVPWGGEGDVWLSVSKKISQHRLVRGGRVMARSGGEKGLDVHVLPPGIKKYQEEEMGGEKSRHFERISSLLSSMGCSRGRDDGFRGGEEEDGCFVVGYLGRLAAEKSVGLVVEAFARVVRERGGVQAKKFVLLILGDGPLREGLEEMVSYHGIASSVIFAGSVPHSQGRQFLYHFVDVLANPNMNEKETFCIVNIEAMSVGIPVVGFARGGPGDYLVDGVTAKVVTVDVGGDGDEESGNLFGDLHGEYGKAIWEIGEQVEERKRIGKEAKRIVEENYSEKHVGEDFRKLVETWRGKGGNWGNFVNSGGGEVTKTRIDNDDTHDDTNDGMHQIDRDNYMIRVKFSPSGENLIMSMSYSCKSPDHVTAGAIAVCGGQDIACFNEARQSLLERCGGGERRKMIDFTMDNKVSINVQLPGGAREIKVHATPNMEEELVSVVVAFCEENGVGESSDCQRIYDFLVGEVNAFFQKNQRRLHAARLYKKWKSEGRGGAGFMNVID